MRLLAACKLDIQPLEDLRILGVEVVHSPGLTAEELPAALRDVNILVVRSLRVTAEAIDAAPSLSLVVRAGVAVSTIDIEAASRAGIYVANCPGSNAAAVAELTIALVLALDRRLVDATVSLREGRWERAEYQVARGLCGRRFGIVGLGSIGRQVACRARGFGMHVHGWSRSLTPAKAQEINVTAAGSLLDLAAGSDVLSVHLPLTPQTHRIVGRSVLDALPDGAIVVNTSRSEIVDEDELEEAVRRKGLRVGLDVFAAQPREDAGRFLPEIMKAGVVYGAPHVGASTAQAQRTVALEVARIVRAFLTEEDVPNVLNVCSNTAARYALVVRLRDEVGVLANVFNVIKRHGLNVEEVSNTIFQGARAGCTKLRLNGRPGEDCLMEIKAFHEVLHVDVISLPNLA
jgi:D-3-phosphoglycerate dehydrogenase